MRSRQANEKKAAIILKKVVSKIDLVPPEFRRAVLNEYYWFSKNPTAQFKLGAKTYNAGDLGGTYSMGVGAFVIAQRMAKISRLRQVEIWAKKVNKSLGNLLCQGVDNLLQPLLLVRTIVRVSRPI